VTEHQVIDSVKRTIEATLKIPFDRIDEEAEFRSFGMDSIIAMEVISKLSKAFSVQMSPAEFAQVSTVRELANKISSSCGDRLEEAGTASDQADGPAAATAPPRPGTVRAAAGRPVTGHRHARSSNDAHSKAIARMVDKVRQKYSIDLDGPFSSVNEILDRLVSEHSDQLVEFYGGELGPIKGQLATPARNRGRGAGKLGSAARSLDVAIVGVACRFPDADDAGQFWTNLLEGKGSIRQVPSSRWSTQEHDSEAAEGKSPTRWAALLEGIDRFDPAFFNMPRALANLIDPQERLLLQEVYRAMQDACLDPKALAGSNTGLFVGYEYLEYEQQIRRGQIDGSIRGLPPLTSASLNYYLANRLSYIFDFRGPSESINVNCASSAVAINRAHASLVLGECDLAVAGGVSLNIFGDDHAALSQQGYLSPTGTCAVLDDDANGYTRGEGVGVVLLKRLADAERDNDRIYAVIKACRQNNRGHAGTISTIDHRSITSVIRDCHAMASVPAESVKYIELNGYATRWADAFEFEGIKNAFAEDATGMKHCAIGSLKGNIGHLEPASGVAAVIKLALAMYNKVFPPTTSIRRLNEFIQLDDSSHPLFLADKPIAFDSLRSAAQERVRAGINSFADSGTNVHILLEEYSAAAGQRTEFESGEPELFVLSARNPQALQASVEQFAAFLEDQGNRLSFADLIYSSQVGRESMECRLGVVASNTRELADKLQRLGRSGLDAASTMQHYGIYCPRVLDPDTAHGSLHQLISRSVTDLQLRHSLKSRQWHEVALLWTNGMDLSWHLIWKDRPARPTSLPGYPFARERCWIDRIEADGLDQLGAGKASMTARRQSQPGPATVVPVEGPAADAVARIWSRVLGIDTAQLDTGRSFFELGGDSRSGLRLLSEINQQFGAALSPADLFGSPSIVDMASKLEQRPVQSLVQYARSARQGLLVPIQSKGTKRPVFGLPGAGGSVLCLQALSEALGKNQPFYGLQSVGIDGSGPPLRSIERMAEAAIGAARRVQAEGPYHLIGYSNGGVVAFEMAQRLMASGDEVLSLIMVDSVSPLQRINNVIEEMVKVCNDLLRVLGSDRQLGVDEFEQIDPDLLMDHLHDVLTSEGFELSKQQFATSFNVIMASDNACRIYRPPACDGKVQAHLFRAASGYPELPQDYGWGELLPRGLKVHEIQADHLTIITGDPIKKIAQRVGRILRQSEADMALSTEANEHDI
jgi:thioesterase domain-containing protein/3-oxoacyl-(acyl-carrier-protein) synthase/acyl carrier protein